MALLLLLQPIAPLQRITLLQGTALLKGIAVELPVDLSVDLPVKPLAPLPPTLLALVRRPIAFLRKHTPKEARRRVSLGTRARVRISAATSASRTSIQRAATASEGPARSERRHHSRAFRQRVWQVPALAVSLAVRQEPRAERGFSLELPIDNHLTGIERARRGVRSLVASARSP